MYTQFLSDCSLFGAFSRKTLIFTSFPPITQGHVCFWCRPGGAAYLGQDQDSVGGGFNGKQSWSGEITQFNIWDFALEDYSIENAAECRSDILGNVMRWDQEFWVTNDVSNIIFVTLYKHVYVDRNEDSSTLWNVRSRRCRKQKMVFIPKQV